MYQSVGAIGDGLVASTATASVAWPIVVGLMQQSPFRKIAVGIYDARKSLRPAP